MLKLLQYCDYIIISNNYSHATKAYVVVVVVVKITDLCVGLIVLLICSSSRRIPGPFTLGTRGFSRVQREFSVLAEGRHIFGHRPKPRAARKVSGTQGRVH